MYKLAKHYKDSTLMFNVIVDGTLDGIKLVEYFKEQMNPENQLRQMLYYNVYDENIPRHHITGTKYYSKNVFVIMPKWE